MQCRINIYEKCVVCAVNVVPIPADSELQQRQANFLLAFRMEWLRWQEHFCSIMVCIHAAVDEYQARNRSTNHCLFIFVEKYFV